MAWLPAFLLLQSSMRASRRATEAFRRSLIPKKPPPIQQSDIESQNAPSTENGYNYDNGECDQ